MKKRRWPWLVLSLVLLLAGAELGTRWYVTHKVRAEIVAFATASDQVQVSVGGWLVLPHLLAGSLPQVNVSAGQLDVQGVRLTQVHAQAREVTTSPPTVIGSLDASALVGMDVVGKQFPALTLRPGDGRLTASLAIAPGLATAAWTVAADGTDLVLKLAGLALGSLEVPTSLLGGDWLAGFSTLRMPIPLPAGVVIETVTVTQTGLRVTLAGKWIQF